MREEPINVTRTFLPPRSEFQRQVDRLWETGWLTNQGPLVQELQVAIGEFLNCPPPHLVANGTLALQLAIRSLDADPGEIITTPFSYVATASAVLWEGHTPVFVDIDPATLCIDPGQIEAAINENTRAILPVHVFGTPCDIHAIGSIADRHGLPVIYDAAHAFGARYQDRSLLEYGTLATCSFHSTKLFHTVEGGCVFTADEALSRWIGLGLRFGHNGDEHLQLGINAKLSELHAAMGLSNLPFIPELIRRRGALVEAYDEQLDGWGTRPLAPLGTTPNHAYYPFLLPDPGARQRVVELAAAQQIHPRRYFYPSLNTLPYSKAQAPCPVSESAADRILCLPLFPELSPDQLQRICGVVIAAVRGHGHN